MADPVPTFGLKPFTESFSPEIDHVGYYAAKPGWVSDPEDLIRDVVNLWYIVEGTGGVRIDGQWVEFSTNDLVTIKPGENYDQERAGGKSPYKVYFVQFYPFIQGNLQAQQHFDDQWPRVISLKYYPEVKGLFMECFEVFNTRSASSRLLEKHMCVVRTARLQPDCSLNGDVYVTRILNHINTSKSYILHDTTRHFNYTIQTTHD